MSCNRCTSDDDIRRVVNSELKKKRLRRAMRVNPYAVCTAMKKKHGWGHKKWKDCVKKVKKRNKR
jgi:hypothetical protein